MVMKQQSISDEIKSKIPPMDKDTENIDLEDKANENVESEPESTALFTSGQEGKEQNVAVYQDGKLVWREEEVPEGADLVNYLDAFGILIDEDDALKAMSWKNGDFYYLIYPPFRPEDMAVSYKTPFPEAELALSQSDAYVKAGLGKEINFNAKQQANMSESNLKTSLVRMQKHDRWNPASIIT